MSHCIWAIHGGARHQSTSSHSQSLFAGGCLAIHSLSPTLCLCMYRPVYMSAWMPLYITCISPSARYQLTQSSMIRQPCLYMGYRVYRPMPIAYTVDKWPRCFNTHRVIIRMFYTFTGWRKKMDGVEHDNRAFYDRDVTWCKLGHILSHELQATTTTIKTKFIWNFVSII